MLLDTIQYIPIGYSEVTFKNRKYGVIRSDFNNRKSFKIYAEELGGTDVISLNYYITSNKEILKPCEMPIEKVLDFLNNYKSILKTKNNEQL